MRATPVGYVVWANGVGFSVPADRDGAVSVDTGDALRRAAGEDRRVRDGHPRLVETADIHFAAQHAGNFGRAAVELGCGPGAVVEELNRAGLVCDGLDPSSDAVAIAVARLADAGYPEARFVCAPTVWPILAARYDSCVVFHDALWGLGSRWELAATLVGARSALRPGGVLMLHLPVNETPTAMSVASPLDGGLLTVTISDAIVGYVSGRVTASVAVHQAAFGTWSYQVSYFPVTPEVIGELAEEQGGWANVTPSEAFTDGCQWMLLRKLG